MLPRGWSRPGGIAGFFAAAGLLTAGLGCEIRDDLTIRSLDGAVDDRISAARPAFAEPLVLGGSAVIAGDLVELTSGREGPLGTAFFAQPFTLSASTVFDVFVRFRVEAAGSTRHADGLALVWHSDRRGTSAMGRSGGGLGYQSIKPAVAVEFDTHKESQHDPNDNHVALVNGDALPFVVAPDLPLDLTSGTDVFSWITYRASTGQLQVFLSSTGERPASPVLSHVLQMRDMLGSTVFVGFTASTGARYSRHVIADVALTFQP